MQTARSGNLELELDPSTCRVPFDSNTGTRPCFPDLVQLFNRVCACPFRHHLTKRLASILPPVFIPLAANSSRSETARKPRANHATHLTMDEISKKKSVEAPSDQPSFAKNEVDADDADRALAAMGYQPVSCFLPQSQFLLCVSNEKRAIVLTNAYNPKQVFKREFGLWSAFSFALSISGLYGTVMTTFSYPLYAGGAASAVWCWAIAGIGAMCLALSISEVASAYPTSGAMYFTIKYLAPEKYVPIIAWIDGVLFILGGPTIGTAPIPGSRRSPGRLIHAH